ncbi:LacI family transcriptional regulator [Paenibacillus psychroresistens]|uniref:LacI family transcriptional regulator n=1 Tax=Paenibacillus psychroresistens TaxID=1778678 RepID=A0A6B8RFV7_9BACL|nr:LacI family DNA-binding transcriptional regulator [Paenibacillus psychroresistens]QGQ94308.1 LacI family transcriptional regulator [Paenibacillus psychroresistens]
MIRIKDIAKLANVSTATISYVLNDSGSVSLETRNKVLKVVADLNYKPNNIAKSLKLKKTNTIGVIVEDITVFNSPEIVDGINDYANTENQSIILTNMRLFKHTGQNFLYQPDSHVEYAQRAMKELMSKQVDGIIYVGIHTRELTNLFNNLQIPIVYTYCYANDQPDLSVNYDDEFGAYDATKYLIDRGHEKIALISGPIDSDPTRLRFNGYYKAIMEHQLIFEPNDIKTGNWEFDSGFTLAKELLQVAKPATAILAMNDLMASGAIHACAELGLSVPRDVSIIGFDNREFSGHLTPALTTMDLPLHELGTQSMSTLLALINKDELPHNPIKPRCKLIERDSVASVSK